MALLGDIQNWGTQYRVYTMRGWVICDTPKEVDEEINKINSILQKEDQYGSRKEKGTTKE